MAIKQYQVIASNEQLAYLAGIVDGEGCIAVYRQKIRARCGRSRSIVVRVFVGNTDPVLIKWIHDVVKLGGTHFRKSQRKGWKGTWMWETSGRKAEVVLRAIRPFLVIKAAQADAALAVYDLISVPGTPMTPERDIQYDDAVATIKRLKNHGDSGISITVQ